VTIPAAVDPSPGIPGAVYTELYTVPVVVFVITHQYQPAAAVEKAVDGKYSQIPGMLLLVGPYVWSRAVPRTRFPVDDPVTVPVLAGPIGTLLCANIYGTFWLADGHCWFGQLI